MLVDINLLPEKERERSSFLYVALAVLVAALLFWLVLYILTRTITTDTERLDEQLAKLQVTQSELSASLNRSDTADAYDRLAASVQWAEDYRYETAPLLEDLVSQLPNRGFFRSFAFAAPHQATVEVQFDDKTEAAYYLTRMLSSEFIETASVDSIATEEFDEEEASVNWLPRYIATYTISFTDPRVNVEGAAPPAAEEESADEEESSEDPLIEEEPDVPEEEGFDAESN